MSDYTVLPDSKTVEEAAQMDVFDIKGEKVKFGNIFADQKTVVVFIRHFFCGSCQAFAEQLAAVSTEALDAAETKIVLIGCGEWEVIQRYADITGFTGGIYANPTRDLFHKLGMTIETLARTPAGEPKRSYLTVGLFANVVTSILKAIKTPSLIGKGGKTSQLGGDFVFGPGNTCSYSSRMKHTEDHVEAADLMKEAGVKLS